MIRRVRNYFWTLRYLTLRQLVFRVWRPLRRRLPKRSVPDTAASSPWSVGLAVAEIPVTWEGVLHSDGVTTASFLNVEKQFVGGVDWSFMDHGLLWNYHLHYLNWLNGLDDDSLVILEDYLKRGHGVGSSLDPYPTSLRIVNTVKAVAAGLIGPSSRVSALVQWDTANLLRNLEYHIGANHLLENGFGLLWGGLFIDHRLAWITGKRIVLNEMREQILQDGGHSERSPMYHAIILWRVLDTINLLSGTVPSVGVTSGVELTLRRHAAAMLGWLRQFPWESDCGHLNDSAPGMAPTRDDLLRYSQRLGIAPESIVLGESGFRTLNGPGALQLLIDAGIPAPRYQPGHAHAGTLGFELYVDEDAVLVDTGVSTYEVGPRRSYERSTRAHNTVSIVRFDSSEVWSAFRVARRARVTIHEDTLTRLVASHDGYRSRFGVVHTRSYDAESDSVVISDQLSGPGSKALSGTATFIVAPGQQIRPVTEAEYIVGPVRISFTGAKGVRIETAEVARGFNRVASSSALRVRFQRHLETTIKIADRSLS